MAINDAAAGDEDMDDPPVDHGHARQLAERVREACIEQALRAYDDAGISGLCQEGRFEAAISAMRVLDLDVLARAAAPRPLT